MAISIRSVLVSDPVHESCADLLREHGINVTCRYRLSADELKTEAKKHDALLVRSETRVSADLLAAAPGLRVVGRAGTGVDNIDLPAATRRGIMVLNTPGGNSVSACELTCALLLALARNVAPASQALREGRWERKQWAGCELQGQTLAVLGLGRIGREVAARMQAFGMRTVGFDPFLSAEAARAFGVEKMELEQIWPLADFVTVHTPLTAETRNLVSADVLSRCKRGVRLVNCARGGIIDEAALLEALKDGRCGGAALDVFEEEPPRSERARALLAHPALLATPHLGASTAQAQRRVAEELAEQLLVLAGKLPAPARGLPGLLNAPAQAAALRQASAPCLQLARELGALGARALQTAGAAEVLITTYGPELQDQPFVAPAALLGLLSGRAPNGLTLVNAPALAAEAGVKVTVAAAAADPTQPEPRLRLAAAGRSLAGGVRAGRPCLLAVDDAEFEQPVLLGGAVRLFAAKEAAAGMGALAVALAAAGAVPTGLATATGKAGAWLAVRTTQPLPDGLAVPGVQAV